MYKPDFQVYRESLKNGHAKEVDAAMSTMRPLSIFWISSDLRKTYDGRGNVVFSK